MAFIDSGPVDASQRFEDVPKNKWRSLVWVKRDFLSVRLNYDCRCLVEFCEEAEIVWEDLGYESAADMIRNGYELDPYEIDLAVAWLKHNGPGEAIGLDAVKAQVADAKDNPLPIDDQKINPRNPNGRKGKESVDNVNRLRGGNDTPYTLRRLARDCPELLDKIEAGELSVNQAAIQAGIRKRPSALDQLRATWRKATEDEREAFLREIEASLAMFRKAMKEQGRRTDLPNNVREVEAVCGNSKAYTCERLKREAPELFEQV
jgi:hypothetical protein